MALLPAVFPPSADPGAARRAHEVTTEGCLRISVLVHACLAASQAEAAVHVRTHHVVAGVELHLDRAERTRPLKLIEAHWRSLPPAPSEGHVQPRGGS
jgi:hypothetical protein